MAGWLAQHGTLARRQGSSYSAGSQRIERGLAAARVFLAFAGLVAIYIDPTEPRRYSGLAYWLLLGYGIHSLLVLTLVRTHEEASPPFRFTVHAVDLLLPAALSWFTSGPNSPFFLFNLFALTAAAYRWEFLETIGTSCAAILLLFVQGILLSTGRPSWHLILPGQFALNSFIIQSIHLLIVGFVLGYIAEEDKQSGMETAIIVRLLSKIRSEMGFRGALGVFFDSLLRTFRSQQALLAIEELSSEQTFLWKRWQDEPGDRADPLVKELDKADRGTYLFEAPGVAWYARQTRHPEIFQSVVLDAQGKITRRVRWRPPEALLKAHTFHSLWAVSITFGNEWLGLCLLLNPQPSGREEMLLRFLSRLTEQVSPGIYSVFLLRRLRSRASAIERGRVARELHDGVIQSLIALEMQVDVLRRQANRQAQATASAADASDGKLQASAANLAGELERIEGILHREVLNVRELMQQMKPVDVEPNQILGHLATLVDKFSHDSGISVRFVSPLEQVRIPMRAFYEVVHIVQEALVNIRKHSGAKNVLVRLDDQNGNWRLLVDDDGGGSGFSGRLTQAELDRARKGPLIIKERVRVLNGELVVESTPGQGTRLEITFPKERP